MLVVVRFLLFVVGVDGFCYIVVVRVACRCAVFVVCSSLYVVLSCMVFRVVVCSFVCCCSFGFVLNVLLIVVFS